MEELIGLFLTFFGEVCCQCFAAGGVYFVEVVAVVMSQRGEPQTRRRWKYVFWSLLPIAVFLTILGVIAMFSQQ